MIAYYHKTLKDAKLRKLQQFKVGTWVHVEAPTEKELEELAKTLSLELGHLKDAVDPFEVPRLEVEGSTIYLFTRVPHTEGSHVVTVPVLLILAKDAVVTVARKDIDLWQKFTSEKVDFYTTQKLKLLLQMFAEIMAIYNEFMTSINRRVRALSVRFETVSNKDIIQFVLFERILTDFLAALTPTNAILQTILSGKHVQLYEYDKDLVEDLQLSSEQLIQNCTSNVATMRNIREAYSTIMTNNLNRVIKIMTALTILIMVPTFITSLYGMNVRLPYQESPHGFLGDSAADIWIHGRILCNIPAQPMAVIETKKLRGFCRLFLRNCAHAARANAHFDAVNCFGLQINVQTAGRGAHGMAADVAALWAAFTQSADS